MTGRERIVIAGGPRTGKTTLALELAAAHGITARHTDELVGTHDWSSASAEVATWFDAPGPWIVEGVAAARALRKWLASHPEGKPADLVRLLNKPREPLAKGQHAMAKGCATVWNEIAAELLVRGVRIAQGVRIETSPDPSW